MNKTHKPVMAVHGGAGTWQPERSQPGLEGVKRAVSKGYDILEHNGEAIDAVEVAVSIMEDDGIFNAGYGSSLTIEKQVEMEASLMNGKNLEAGATGLLRDIKNPVHLARIVMDQTDHVFVVGEGAERLALLNKLERKNPMTDLRLKYYEQQLQTFDAGRYELLPRITKLAKENPNLFHLGTVGAVALDIHGNTAAATSTGGMPLKMPGRIGDSPSIGSGTYADNLTGAVSTTGVGEIAMRLVLAKTVCDIMGRRRAAQEAAEEAIRLVNTRIQAPVKSMGLIAVDTHGNIGAAHNSPNMCWAKQTPLMKEAKGFLTAEIVK